MEKILSLLALMLLVILALFSTTLSLQAEPHSALVRCHQCTNTDNRECGIPFNETSRIEKCTGTYCWMDRGEYNRRFTLYDIFFSSAFESYSNFCPN